MMAEFARQMSADSLLTHWLRDGRHPTGGGCLCLAGTCPPLESRGHRDELTARTIHCDVVVIGQGPAGVAAADEASEAGAHVETLDSGDGQDAIGIYPGPLVVARTAAGMLHLYPR